MYKMLHILIYKNSAELNFKNNIKQLIEKNLRIAAETFSCHA